MTEYESKKQGGKIIVGGYEVKSKLMTKFFDLYEENYFKQEIMESIRDSIGRNIIEELDQTLFKAEEAVDRKDKHGALKFYNDAFTKLDSCVRIDQKLKSELKNWIRSEIILAHY